MNNYLNMWALTLALIFSSVVAVDSLSNFDLASDEYKKAELNLRK